MLFHQVSAKLWPNIESTLTDLRFINAKCAAGMTFELVKDYSLALDALPEAFDGKQNEKVRLAQAVQYTQSLISFAKGDSRLPKPIPTIKPWDDKQIEKYIQKITRDPTRLNRIMAFAQFVTAESYSLAKFSHLPGFCFQQAYNSASTGLVAESAQKIIEGETHSILLLNAPNQRPTYHPHPALLRTLEGHGSRGASSVRMMQGGKRAISSGFDRTLRIWDLETGECTRVLEGHTSWIEDMQVTPDGKWAVSGGDDSLLWIWDLERGECLKVLDGHTKRINGVAISADGRRVVSGTGGEKACLMVWDVPSGTCTRVIDGYSGEGLRITPDGRIAVVPSIRKWDLETGTCLLKGQGKWMYCVDITPDGKTAISGGADGELQVWNLENGRCLKKINADSRWISAISITPDGKLAVAGGGEMTLRLWDLKSGKCIRALEGHTGAINSLDISPNGSRVISASEDQTLRLWDLERGESVHFEVDIKNWIKKVDLSVDGKFTISNSSNNYLRIWDADNGKMLGQMEKNHIMALLPDSIQAVSGGEKQLHLLDVPEVKPVKTYGTTTRVDHNLLSVAAPDGKRLYLAGSLNFVGGVDLENGTSIDFKHHSGSGTKGICLMKDGKHAIWSGSSDICIWDLETGKSIKTLQEGYQSIFGMSATPDGRKAISGGFEKILYVWDVIAGNILCKLTGHTDTIWSVGITPDGIWGISGSSDGTVRVWDTVLAKCVRILEGHTDKINSVAISDDGRIAVSAGDDRLVLVWDIISGKCMHRHVGHSEPPNVVCISRNGEFAVSGGRDCAIFVWNLKNGRCIRKLGGHTGYVNCLALTADGKILVSGSADKTIKVWDLARGECIRTLQGHSEVVTDVSITPEGRKAISCSYEEFLQWDLEKGICTGSVEHTSHDNYCFDVTPDGKRPISGGYRGYCIWDVDTRDWIKTYRVGRQFHALKVSPDGRQLVTGDYDTSVGVWNIRNGNRLLELKGHTDRIESVSLSKDGKTIISGSWDKSILVWDMHSGKCVAAYQALSSVTALSEIHSNGKFAFGTETGEVITVLPRNFPWGIPWVTAVRRWQNISGVNNGNWDDRITTLCPTCRERFTVDDEILQTIKKINQEHMDPTDQSPCFSLPDHAWEDERLRSNCPKCAHKIKFNPFIVDNLK